MERTLLVKVTHYRMACIQSRLPNDTSHEEERTICHAAVICQTEAVFKPSNYSTFSRIQRITAWIFRFVHNCRTTRIVSAMLSVSELSRAEAYWLFIAQNDDYPQELKALKSNCSIPSNSPLISFDPFIDHDGLMHACGWPTF